MGWLTSAALRESKLLKKLLGLSSYQLDNNGNVIGFLDASGMPMASKAVPWAEFITLGSGDVQDRSAVWVYDKQCMFVWNDLAARWYQVGGELRFSTFAELLIQVPAAAWKGLVAYCDDVLFPLKSNGTRYKPLGGSGYLFNEVNGTLGSPTKSLGNNSGVLPQLFTLASPDVPGSLIQPGDTLFINFDAQRHGTGAMLLVLCLGTSSAVLTDAVLWSSGIATTDLAKPAGVIKVNVGSNTSASTNGTLGIQQTGGNGSGTRTSVTANLDFTVAQKFKMGLSVKGTNADALDLMQFSCLLVSP